MATPAVAPKAKAKAEATPAVAATLEVAATPAVDNSEKPKKETDDELPERTEVPKAQATQLAQPVKEQEEAFGGLGDSQQRDVPEEPTEVDCSSKSLAKEMLLVAERVRESTKELVMNFITFAEKIRTVAGPGPLQLHALQQMGLRFGGSLVNATMIKTVESLEKLMTDGARCKLFELDRRYGRDVLSGVYSKVRLLVGGCMAAKNIDGCNGHG